MTEPCIAQEIWDRCRPGADLVTAQGRAALDRALRAEMGKIEDASLRSHAGAVLARLRAEAFQVAADRHMAPAVVVRLEYLEARCAWLESQMTALVGADAPKPESAQPVEIHSIRGARQ